MALIRLIADPVRRRRVLIADIKDDDGKTMCRIWDDGPWETTSRPARADYGPNWPLVRAQILTRDGWRCITCGDDFDLHVHHIRPLRLFDGDFESANRDDNLVTLCQPCHGRVHAQLRAESA